MPSHYDGLGVTVMYPDNWKVEDETDETVTLESPGGAFLIISRQDASIPIDQLLEEAGAAMEAEYDIVEREEETEEFGSCSLPVRVQRFVYLDLIVAARFYALKTDTCSYLLQVQGVDTDVDELLPVFRAMITTLCQSAVAR